MSRVPRFARQPRSSRSGGHNPIGRQAIARPPPEVGSACTPCARSGENELGIITEWTLIAKNSSAILIAPSALARKSCVTSRVRFRNALLVVRQPLAALGRLLRTTYLALGTASSVSEVFRCDIHRGPISGSIRFEGRRYPARDSTNRRATPDASRSRTLFFAVSRFRTELFNSLPVGR